MPERFSSLKELHEKLWDKAQEVDQDGNKKIYTQLFDFFLFQGPFWFFVVSDGRREVPVASPPFFSVLCYVMFKAIEKPVKKHIKTS